jgi:hypothetical protein
MNIEGGDIDHNKGKTKFFKYKMESILVLGEGVKLHEVLTMEKVALIGHFTSKQMSMETLQRWMVENFKGILGYTPKCVFDALFFGMDNIFR